mmetsp:Transcript_23979/g.75395  ORF Transcript_23979/g.75395 Transcript_23979/m.75395 type:complete len:269 (-) Transcript_23979:608-1414(-)
MPASNGQASWLPESVWPPPPTPPAVSSCDRRLSVRNARVAYLAGSEGLGCLAEPWSRPWEHCSRHCVLLHVALRSMGALRCACHSHSSRKTATSSSALQPLPLRAWLTPSKSPSPASRRAPETAPARSRRAADVQGGVTKSRSATATERCAIRGSCARVRRAATSCSGAMARRCAEGQAACSSRRAQAAKGASQGAGPSSSPTRNPTKASRKGLGMGTDGSAAESAEPPAASAAASWRNAACSSGPGLLPPSAFGPSQAGTSKPDPVA